MLAQAVDDFAHAQVQPLPQPGPIPIGPGHLPAVVVAHPVGLVVRVGDVGVLAVAAAGEQPIVIVKAVGEGAFLVQLQPGAAAAQDKGAFALLSAACAGAGVQLEAGPPVQAPGKMADAHLDHVLPGRGEGVFQRHAAGIVLRLLDGMAQGVRVDAVLGKLILQQHLGRVQFIAGAAGPQSVREFHRLPPRLLQDNRI